VGELSQAAREVYGLITDFVQRVPGVANSVVVSSDGLPLAVSGQLAKDPADQLATVAAGLVSLTQSASRVFTGWGGDADRGGDGGRRSDGQVNQ